MELVLEAMQEKQGTAETVRVDLLVLNDSYEPVSIDRRLLVGPNPVPDNSTGIPFPVSVEPALSPEDDNLIVLNPWCFYGRQRTYDNLPPGRVTIHAYLLRQTSDVLLPEKPGAEEALLLSADPLEIVIDGGD